MQQFFISRILLMYVTLTAPSLPKRRPEAGDGQYAVTVMGGSVLHAGNSGHITSVHWAISSIVTVVQYARRTTVSCLNAVLQHVLNTVLYIDSVVSRFLGKFTESRTVE